ncbi:MAG: GNAT family N-acetyltransferase [Myxococcales bacterium]|nr:MAG: GNAT family N-acetyltransferase [Myxococcales bacterium]
MGRRVARLRPRHVVPLARLGRDLGRGSPWRARARGSHRRALRRQERAAPSQRGACSWHAPLPRLAGGQLRGLARGGAAREGPRRAPALLPDRRGPRPLLAGVPLGCTGRGPHRGNGRAGDHPRAPPRRKLRGAPAPLVERPALGRASGTPRRARGRHRDRAREWRAYYALYQASLARWGERASSRYDWSLFERIRARDPETARLWVARLGSEVVAGALVFYAPRHAAWWHASTAAAHFRKRPMNLLLHEMIRDACEQDLAILDLGPSHAHDGVEEFKAGYAAEVFACPMIRTEPRSWRTRLRRALSSVVR